MTNPNVQEQTTEHANRNDPANVQAYLTLKLADEVFALNVKRVREVLEVPHITQVPHAPPAMCGVINLRGKVLPVIDTRMRFGLSKAELTRETAIVVIEVQDKETQQDTLIGAVVDQALKVQEIDANQMEPPPSLGTAYRADFVTGVAKDNDRFILVLDMDKVFALSELKSLEALTEKVPLPEKQNAQQSKEQAEQDSDSE